MLAISMELGIKVVTVYAFSIENFKRPPDQVETLMELAKVKLAELCEHRYDLIQVYIILFNERIYFKLTYDNITTSQLN